MTKAPRRLEAGVRRLLVVDDDPSVRALLGELARRSGLEVEAVGSGEEAVRVFRRRRPDVVALDVVLPGMDGLQTLKTLKSIDPNVPVVMLSGHGQTATVVEAMRAGAADFLRKPFEPEELELAIQKALEQDRLQREVAYLRRRRAEPESPGLLIFGDNPKMRQVEEIIDQVADTDITVLIRGESGTGKELVARTLYQRSSRRDRPFIKVNCAALPSELLESELFGFEKGAFTGAQRRKLGKFEIAHGGTIFLDEISEMHPNLQAKLLQVLQDGQFSRLGGETDIRVDARVICATNRNLEEAVREGSFREDLFYRINVVTIYLPPLRERKDEIPLLAEHFLNRYAREYGRPVPRLSERLLEAFLAYDWPGNVRELENLIKRLVVLGSEEPVLAEIGSRARARRERAADGAAIPELERFLRGEVERLDLKRIAREAAREAERRVLERVLERTRWNRKEAARILQISYKALLYKMRDAGLAER